VIDALSTLQEAERITEIIVVDNGSSEATQAYLCELERRDSRVRVVHFEKNMGSAAGFKAGLEAAIRADCDYIWLLDDDNRPERKALSVLLEAADSQQDCALLSLRSDRQAYIEYAEDGDIEKAFGRRHNFLGFSWQDTFKKFNFSGFKPAPAPKAERSRRRLVVPYAPYGGLFAKRSHLQRIGLPREDFYLYEDDREYTSRLTAAHVPIYLIPASILRDIDLSWYMQAQGGYFLSPYVLLTPEREKRRRLYYGVRNRVYLEKRAASRNLLEYHCNMLLYLGGLGLASLTGSALHRSLNPLASYQVVLRAVKHGYTGHLGKI
jgi:glycosyltransferase involved in cell wall biosynthesis